MVSSGKGVVTCGEQQQGSATVAGNARHAQPNDNERRQLPSSIAAGSVRASGTQIAGTSGDEHGERGGAPGAARPGADWRTNAELTQTTDHGVRDTLRLGGGSGRSVGVERAPVGGSSAKHVERAADVTRGSTAPRLQG